MTGLTFDMEALIALERRQPRMRAVLERALAIDQPITVPADVVAEWWRGRTDVPDAIVMASAASRGDIMYTSDVDDLERLRRHFPGVRILAV